MPVPMVAKLTVALSDGRVVSESAHPSFELAWKQAQRELIKKAEVLRVLPEAASEIVAGRILSAYRTMGMILPGEGSVMVQGAGNAALSHYYVDAYEPVSSIEPTEWATIADQEAATKWTREVVDGLE